jgi:hypothetical protein
MDLVDRLRKQRDIPGRRFAGPEWLSAELGMDRLFGSGRPLVMLAVRHALPWANHVHILLEHLIESNRCSARRKRAMPGRNGTRLPMKSAICFKMEGNPRQVRL